MRNVIERIFGVIKQRWEILVVPPHYSMELQSKVPAALAALHNFILEHDPMEDLEEEVLGEDMHDPMPGAFPGAAEGQGALAASHLTDEESEEGKIMRDRIADAMWTDYCLVVEARERQARERGDEGDAMDQD